MCHTTHLTYVGLWYNVVQGMRVHGVGLRVNTHPSWSVSAHVSHVAAQLTSQLEGVVPGVTGCSLQLHPATRLEQICGTTPKRGGIPKGYPGHAGTPAHHRIGRAESKGQDALGASDVYVQMLNVMRVTKCSLWKLVYSEVVSLCSGQEFYACTCIHGFPEYVHNQTNATSFKFGFMHFFSLYFWKNSG